MNNVDFFEHTADVGFRLQRPTRELLFADAARAMLGLIAPDSQFSAEISKSVSAQGDDDEQLFVNWLSELNVIFQTELFVPVEFESIEMMPDSITAQVKGGRVNPEKHNIELEIKAVTYHKLYVKQEDEWKAQVIFDI